MDLHNILRSLTDLAAELLVSILIHFHSKNCIRNICKLHHVWIPGDRLVGTGQAGQQWARPQNVRTNLFYPTNGIGAVLTYLEVLVNQSTNLGRAYVVSGGIGQRQIGVVIEAQSTLYFSYRASLFGYWAYIDWCERNSNYFSCDKVILNNLCQFAQFWNTVFYLKFLKSIKANEFLFYMIFNWCSWLLFLLVLRFFQV